VVHWRAWAGRYPPRSPRRVGFLRCVDDSAVRAVDAELLARVPVYRCGGNQCLSSRTTPATGSVAVCGARWTHWRNKNPASGMRRLYLLGLIARVPMRAKAEPTFVTCAGRSHDHRVPHGRPASAHRQLIRQVPNSFVCRRFFPGETTAECQTNCGVEFPTHSGGHRKTGAGLLAASPRPPLPDGRLTRVHC
jgi:hypothetical protein